jgi:hypothetical protein
MKLNDIEEKIKKKFENIKKTGDTLGELCYIYNEIELNNCLQNKIQFYVNIRFIDLNKISIINRINDSNNLVNLDFNIIKKMIYEKTNDHLNEKEIKKQFKQINREFRINICLSWTSFMKYSEPRINKYNIIRPIIKRKSTDDDINEESSKKTKN